MSWIDAARTRFNLLFRRRAAESRMHDEIRFHIAREAERIAHDEGVTHDEARRRALVAFGGVEKHKEALRADRGASWISGLSLDLRLGARMLAKYPWLTAVSVVGMAVAVAISAVAYGVLDQMMGAKLPIDDGDRVVALSNVDTRKRDEALSTHLHDLADWRAQLTTLDNVSAYRTADRNLITAAGEVVTLRMVEMTASGFDLAHVTPFLGRYLHAADERAGAPPVVVVGHRLWQRQFHGDSALVGRSIQIGAKSFVVIGVMPPGFAFPINNSIWTPLQLNPLDYERGKAPATWVFGRLARGATIRDVEREAGIINQRLAAAHLAVYENVRPRVMPYTDSFFYSEPGSWREFRLAQASVALLVVVIGVNVALLVFARNAGRTGEIALRSALGASRSRIVAQFFVEAFVLASVATSVGLGLAQLAFAQIGAFVRNAAGDQIPYWIRFGVTPSTAAYAIGLTLLAATIVGVFPALKATRRDLMANFHQMGTGGAGLRLGAAWNTMITAQVAVTVGLLSVAAGAASQFYRNGIDEPSIDASQYVTATVRLDREGAGTNDFDAYAGNAFTQRLAMLEASLVHRISAEPGVSRVTLMTTLWGGDESSRIEIEGVPTVRPDTVAPRNWNRYSSISGVDTGYFGAFNIALIAGRALSPADFSLGADVAVVNQSFVRRFVGSGYPLGVRFRRAPAVRDASDAVETTEPWLQIVGIVADSRRARDPRILQPQAYVPRLPASSHPVRFAVHVPNNSAAAVAENLAHIAPSVDPMLRISGIRLLHDLRREANSITGTSAYAVGALLLSVLLLAAAGIYALMSFTVTRRRREIGIRVALGANTRRIISGVLARAVAQITAGAAAGVVIALLLDWWSRGELMDGNAFIALAVVGVIVGTVGLLAAMGPARAALRVQPTEVLKG